LIALMIEAKAEGMAGSVVVAMWVVILPVAGCAG
jgi:hypothetical protein